MEIQPGRTGLEEKIYQLSQRVVQETDFELYDVTYNSINNLLRVFIYEKSTQSAEINDCVEVDRAFSRYIESEDWLPEKLTLEVSSPGLYRKIKTLSHFRMSIGKLIKVHFGPEIKPEKFKNKKVIAMLNNCNDDSIDLTTQKDEEIINVNFINIKSVNAEYQF